MLMLIVKIILTTMSFILGVYMLSFGHFLGSHPLSKDEKAGGIFAVSIMFVLWFILTVILARTI